MRTRGHAGHPARTVGLLAAAAALVVAACGGGEDDADVRVLPPSSTTIAPAGRSDGAAPTTTASEPTESGPTESEPTATTVTLASGPVSTLDRPAVVTEPAERITEVAVVAWIGGSDVVLDDRNLPAAVGSRVDAIGDRPVIFRADTMIAPTVADVRDRVEAAAAGGADALIVALNISWIHWDGAGCEGMTPAEARYACLMTPVSPDVTAANTAELSQLVDAIVATGLPAYLYTIPHSAESLTDPRLADLITAAERAMVALDPGVEQVELVGIFNRGLPDMGVGDGFINIVHPTVAGVERLADALATDLVRFWNDLES